MHNTHEKFHFTSEHIFRHALERMGKYELLDMHMREHHPEDAESVSPSHDHSIDADRMRRIIKTIRIAFDRIKTDVKEDCHETISHHKKKMPFIVIEKSGGYYELPEDFLEFAPESRHHKLYEKDGKRYWVNPNNDPAYYISIHKEKADHEGHYSQKVADLILQKLCREIGIMHCAAGGEMDDALDAIQECIEEAEEDLEAPTHHGHSYATKSLLM